MIKVQSDIDFVFPNGNYISGTKLVLMPCPTAVLQWFFFHYYLDKTKRWLTENMTTMQKHMLHNCCTCI